MHKGHQVTFAQPRDVSFARDETRPASQDEASDGPALGYYGPCAAGAAALGSCRLVLASGPEAPKRAREFTTATLRDWELDALVNDAVIIASELVTNAIRHGSRRASQGTSHQQVELAWQRHLTQVICAVIDGSATPPVLAAAELDAECGRGLLVVQALAAGWGWTMLGPAQKAVWAALELAIGS
jgi:anti-sigma regulatory factor (Ser/Thr protein kinase)